MKLNPLFSDSFRYGPDVWEELVTAVNHFCNSRESCASIDCPISSVYVPATEISAAMPGRYFAMNSKFRLCSIYAVFTRPEQVAAIVGCQLPDLDNSADAVLLESNVSFSDLFSTE
jgi:hypothetical protein